jgi:transposase
VRTFGPVTRDLEALLDWLLEAGATHMRNVPGRKTDVKDSEWIADLVRHGLIAKSFVPPRPLRELRDLLRYRRKLVESQAAERNRLLKLLKDRQHQAGECRQRRLRRVQPRDAPSADRGRDLGRGDGGSRQGTAPQALRSHPGARWAPRGASPLPPGHATARLEAIEADIAALDLRIGERLEPYSAPHALLMQIPGVDWVVAAVLIAEIGVDMSVFLSVYHLSAWAGVCPGSHESAGRQKSGRARKGNIHLRTILVASRTRGSYLKDKFHRLKAPGGAMRAALATAHKILVSAYHMLAKGLAYQRPRRSLPRLDRPDSNRRRLGRGPRRTTRRHATSVS